ncbi:TM2 domain-containing protein [Bacillus cereus]|nr:TM2 domain-containing protein [Bacillus cereus]
MKTKSKLFAYILFFSGGGLFGLPYLYLGQNEKFFIKAITLNYLLIGFVKDLFSLGAQVDLHNGKVNGTVTKHIHIRM